MKQWKDGKNRFELHLCGKQEGVLYRLEENYLFRVYTDGGEFDKAIYASTVDEAKQAAEKWLLSHLTARNCLSRKMIQTKHKLIQALLEDSESPEKNAERSNMPNGSMKTYNIGFNKNDETQFDCDDMRELFECFYFFLKENRIALTSVDYIEESECSSGMENQNAQMRELLLFISDEFDRGRCNHTEIEERLAALSRESWW